MRIKLLLTAITISQSCFSMQLQEILSMKADYHQNNTESSLKIEAINEEAFSFASQHAYIYQLNQIKEQIQNKKDELDKVFNFTALINQTNVGSSKAFLIPPIISQSENLISIKNKNKIIETTGISYEILENARLSPVIPDWREYLIREDLLVKPNKPHNSIMPQYPEERKLWEKNVIAGWKYGIDNANNEMLYRIRRLNRDFNGIIMYNMLVKKGIVQEPKVQMTKSPVKNGKKSMDIENTTYKIITGVNLNPNTKKWKFIHE